MADAKIDVSIEHKQAPEPPQKKHPNTCPSCGSHYRDDELAASLRVCTQCGHHFPVKAHERIEQLVDQGSFVEEAETSARPIRSASSISAPTTSGWPRRRSRPGWATRS
jgi:acetyl-CoA carboxylase beta subunit